MCWELPAVTSAHQELSTHTVTTGAFSLKPQQTQCGTLETALTPQGHCSSQEGTCIPRRLKAKDQKSPHLAYGGKKRPKPQKQSRMSDIKQRGYIKKDKLNADAGGPQLLTKLSDFLFNLACSLSGPKVKLTVQATFPL
ncbi:hypothetical protein H920_07027 [Fukomys damarensis]|uniref:Uncharacterized protein n=1 Tax=Fukomys damarensis TaxID=885580 RepID=A0A091DM02_FUKDA|nr:hypothetical protein H920_07027 [Fukomys damarensis]